MPSNNQNQGKNSSKNQGRGFAGMDPDRQREIASEGGKAAHASGNAHEFDSEEASEAGRKGGASRSQGSNQSQGGSHEQHVEAGCQSHKNTQQ